MNPIFAYYENNKIADMISAGTMELNFVVHLFHFLSNQICMHAQTVLQGSEKLSGRSQKGVGESLIGEIFPLL